jgi:hypothetical protein
MGMWITYNAERDTPLSAVEERKIARLIGDYDLDKRPAEAIAAEREDDEDDDDGGEQSVYPPPTYEDSPEELAQMQKEGEEVAREMESFHVYGPDPDNPRSIVAGEVRLGRFEQLNQIFSRIKHWCKLLTEVRRAVPGATWQVFVGEDEVQWDEKRQEFIAPA